MTQTLLDRTITPLPRHNAREVACQGGPIPPESQRPIVSRRVAKAFARFAQPTGIQIVQSYKMGCQTCYGKLDCGPVIVCQLSADQHETYQVLFASMGCRLSVTLRLIWGVSFKVILTAFAFRKLTGYPGLNFSFNLRVSTIVPDYSAVFLAAKSGDVHTLKRLLSSGMANITDVTTRGDTLLHVCAIAKYLIVQANLFRLQPSTIDKR